MKAFSKLWQYWQRFWEPTDEIPFIVKLLLGVLVVATVAVMVSDSIANCLQQLLSEKYDVLKVIGYCVAGVVSVWLAWAANKRAKAMEDTAKEQAKATENQAKATENTEEGQRQERLKNAIEHLGHDGDSVRMGGSYELFHLAKDTEKLRQTVMNILCAHIRQTTTGQTARGNAYQAEHRTKPSEEIQSLLTLLLIEEHDVFEDCSINLQGSYLNGATLSQARLKKADLRRAQLQGTALMGAQLQGTLLYKAQLQGAGLRHAQLQRAVLKQARLQRADLMGARLQGAILGAARMQGAGLMGARMQGAELGQAQLQGATLVYAQMQGANLFRAQLQGAHLFKAQLQEATLRDAQLQGISSQERYPFPSAQFEFEIEIRNRIDRPGDLTGIIFTGGLQEKNLDSLCGGLSAEKAQELREKLRPHVGKPVSNELPTDSGAVIGSYTKEEAEQWIAEYQEAMREVPKRDNS